MFRHLGPFNATLNEILKFFCFCPVGAATHQNAGSNVTHDINCFTKTRGKTGNSTNIATASVSEHHQAADCQLNSDNSVFDITQQSSSHTTQGNLAYFLWNYTLLSPNEIVMLFSLSQ
jgi:hypothetical protein